MRHAGLLARISVHGDSRSGVRVSICLSPMVDLSELFLKDPRSEELVRSVSLTFTLHADGKRERKTSEGAAMPNGMAGVGNRDLDREDLAPIVCSRSAEHRQKSDYFGVSGIMIRVFRRKSAVQFTESDSISLNNRRIRPNSRTILE